MVLWSSSKLSAPLVLEQAALPSVLGDPKHGGRSCVFAGVKAQSEREYDMLLMMSE